MSSIKERRAGLGRTSKAANASLCTSSLTFLPTPPESVERAPGKWTLEWHALHSTTQPFFSQRSHTRLFTFVMLICLSFTNFACCFAKVAPNPSCGTTCSAKEKYHDTVRTISFPFVPKCIRIEVREGWLYQIQWIFRKVPKGEGGYFQSKNLCCRFWEP